jgi:hypothetical protein
MLLLSHRGGGGSGLGLSMLLGCKGGMLLLVLRLMLWVMMMLLLLMMLRRLVLLMLQPRQFSLRVLVLVGENVLSLSLKHDERTGVRNYR